MIPWRTRRPEKEEAAVKCAADWVLLGQSGPHLFHAVERNIKCSLPLLIGGVNRKIIAPTRETTPSSAQLVTLLEIINLRVGSSLRRCANWLASISIDPLNGQLSECVWLKRSFYWVMLKHCRLRPVNFFHFCLPSALFSGLNWVLWAEITMNGL